MTKSGIELGREHAARLEAYLAGIIATTFIAYMFYSIMASVLKKSSLKPIR